MRNIKCIKATNSEIISYKFDNNFIDIYCYLLIYLSIGTLNKSEDLYIFYLSSDYVIRDYFLHDKIQYIFKTVLL